MKSEKVGNRKEQEIRKHKKSDKEGIKKSRKPEKV